MTVTPPRSGIPRAVRDAIDAGDWRRLMALRDAWPLPHHVAQEVAERLRDTERQERPLFFRSLPEPIAAEVFAELDRNLRDELIYQLSDGETQRLLADLSPDDRTDVLSALPGRVTQRLMTLLDPDDMAEVKSLLGYAGDSVGRFMTPDYLAIKPHWSVRRAIQHVRERGRTSETAAVVYVVDERWVLIDALALQTLVFASEDESVESLMDGIFVSIQADADREEAVRLMQRHDRVALPVVDDAGVLIGIVTVDDVMDVAEAEATEDFHRSAAMEPLPGSYWETSAMFLYRARVGWLALLVFVNLLSSGVIAAFEETLAAVVTLAFFIPLIIDTGGNAGSQAATLMVRAISTRDVRLHEWARVLGKEVFVGLGLGATLGVLGGLLGLWRGTPEIGLVVFLTMVSIMMVTNVIGLLLPFALTALRRDPATASGPLITSVADAVGLLIYFSFAVLILGDVT
jgi:magnesium transporter